MLRKSIFLILPLLFTLSCVSSRQEIDLLHEQVFSLQQQQTALDKNIQALREDVGRLSQSMQPAQANISADLEQMKVDLATLQGQMQELRVNLGAGSGLSLTQMKQRLDRQEAALRQIAGQLAIEIDLPEPQPSSSVEEPPYFLPPSAAYTAPPSVETPDPMSEEPPPGELMIPAGPSTGPETAPGPPPDLTAQPPAPANATTRPSADPAEALYSQAMQAFRDRRYLEAQSIWSEFVKVFPKHDLTPNALFWQGECYYQLGDFAQAVLAYQEVISNYKNSNKYAPSLLKQGISFYKMGKKEPGKIVLEDLMNKFPDSAEAKRAQEFLKNN